MVDSVQVFDPGFRVADANGNPVNNAKIKFREAGPGATKTVYSDKELSTALGHTIRTRADGYPVVSEGSSTTCLIYVNEDAYHVEITDEDDVAIFPAKDNVRGALSTADFLDSDDLTTFVIPVLSKTSNHAILEAERGTLFVGNAGGGFFTFTLPSAVTVGDDWNVGIRNDGSTNQVGISAAHAIATPMGALTALSLRPGETVWLVSNGATWKIKSYTPPLQGTTGLILIADRLSTPPGGVTAGARYIVGSSPTDAWSTFAEHDIAEADGQGAWFKFTPPTDCGWLAFVQDENAYYGFHGSAWAELFPAASGSVAGIIRRATQAEMETPASLLIAVAPGAQQFHPGHPKAWLRYDGASVPTIGGDHGIASMTDNGSGDHTVNFDTAFSDAAAYGFAGMGQRPSTNETMIIICKQGVAPATTSHNIASTVAGTASDSDETGLIWCGDH